MCDRLRWDGLGLWLCVAALLTIGCAGDSGTPVGSGGGASVAVPEELPSGEMPPMEEATELVRQIEATMASGDDSVLGEAMDWNLLCSRSMSEIDAPEDLRIGFRTGFLKGVTENGNLPRQVSRSLDRVAANFEVEFEDLTQIPEYAEYVKSPEYQKWLESRMQNTLESDALVQ